MSSVVLMFPIQDEETGRTHYRQLAHFWIPEKTAEERKHLIDYRAWEKAGCLTIVPGAVISYQDIREALAEYHERFAVKSFSFDPMYATDTAQWVQENYPDIEVIKFAQTIIQFAGPTAEYERLILGRGLLHNKNPLLTWQASHCKVWTDSNRNKRPTKPKPNDIRAVDGIVAGVMALARAWQPPEAPSAYEDDETPIYSVEDLMSEEFSEHDEHDEALPGNDGGNADDAGETDEEFSEHDEHDEALPGNDGGNADDAGETDETADAGPKAPAKPRAKPKAKAAGKKEPEHDEALPGNDGGNADDAGETDETADAGPKAPAKPRAKPKAKAAGKKEPEAEVPKGPTALDVAIDAIMHGEQVDCTMHACAAASARASRISRSSSTRPTRPSAAASCWTKSAAWTKSSHELRSQARPHAQAEPGPHRPPV